MSDYISSQVSNMSYAYSMLQAQYRRIQQKSDGQTLLVTIPTEFAQAIQLRKADTVKMTLSKENKSIVVQRATD